jgi:hypothetical protein
MKVRFLVAATVAFLAVPTLTNAQGVIGGAQQGANQGAKQGSKAAGPIGGVVGGAVGGTVGAVSGGAQSVLGTSSSGKKKPKKQTP